MLAKRSSFIDGLRNFGLVIICFFLTTVVPQGITAGEDESEYVPDRYGIAPQIGYTYNPSDDIGFFMLSGFVLYDYDKIWPHRAPEALRFKVETSMGTSFTPDWKFMASVMIFAVYYLDDFHIGKLRPFVEAGIGGIYTDWQVEGQGSRINFNPQLGIGTEFPGGSDSSFFATLRLHHFSNGGLGDDNRGVNSVVFMVGKFF